MKCKSCGGEIALSDKVCPHCGRSLAETAGYRADMEHYRGESVRTKKRAGQIISENIPIVISAVIMLLLVIFDAVLLYVNKNAYSFRDDAARRESVRQYEAYSATITDLLDAGDYTAFNAFMEYHNIAFWEEPYEDLRLVYEMAEKYSDLVSAVESATMYGKDAKKYDPESDISDCRRAIRYFNEEYERALSQTDEDPYRDYIHDMKAKADMIMEVYLGLDAAGREEYLASSDIRQEAYLEEVLIHD